MEKKTEEEVWKEHKRIYIQLQKGDNTKEKGKKK
jgi:hypothetical protein